VDSPRGEQARLSEPPRPASAPRHPSPAGATDCHFHMLGPQNRYKLSPTRGYTPAPESNMRTYLDMANTLGIERMVIVQPVAYGKDHACTLDSIEILGRHRTRAIAVIDESFSEATLRGMDQRGFCGARINSITPNSTGLDHLESVVRLIAPLGWHVQLFVHGAELPDLEKRILSLPVPAVIDHMGQIPTDRGINSPEFLTLLRLLESGKCWVKLCGYRSSVAGPPYADLLEPARKLIETAPERCVWGTDWPHTNMFGSLLPDDGKLLDLLYDWAPDPGQLRRILVENPAQLYGFVA
jgi:predicted TIM-barrel fold metal-dependent hydrolase